MPAGQIKFSIKSAIDPFRKPLQITVYLDTHTISFFDLLAAICSDEKIYSHMPDLPPLCPVFDFFTRVEQYYPQELKAEWETWKRHYQPGMKMMFSALRRKILSKQLSQVRQTIHELEALESAPIFEHQEVVLPAIEETRVRLRVFEEIASHN